MPKLNPEELQSRLRFDWRIAQGITSPLLAIQAFKSMPDLNRRKNPISGLQDAHRAVSYLVEYRIRSLVGKGKFHQRFDVSIDLLAGGNYPYSEPQCFVISQPIPWSPHFLPSKGAICLGELWTSSRGSITLGHLILHIAKLLNFDEPDRESSYGGWNAEAVNYWRQVMKRQPVTPGLVYPALPPELTHGLKSDIGRVLFRATTVAAAAKPPQTLFRPLGR